VTPEFSSASERLERVLALIEKLEIHQRRMEAMIAAIIDLSEPGDDLALECNRLLRALNNR
jgi:hypothetical protein